MVTNVEFKPLLMSLEFLIFLEHFFNFVSLFLIELRNYTPKKAPSVNKKTTIEFSYLMFKRGLILLTISHLLTILLFNLILFILHYQLSISNYYY